MTRSSRFLSLSLALLAVMVSTAAEAHIGTGTAHHGGFAAGFAHPFSGLDHLLAMLSVGAWAMQAGGRHLWLAPLSFIGMMIVGGILGMSGVALSPVETGIAASVVVLGLALATAWRPSPAVMGAISGAFALFHGHAHGTEMAQTLSPAFYSSGFVIASALLIAAGMGVAWMLSRRATAWAGAGVAVAGVVLLLA